MGKEWKYFSVYIFLTRDSRLLEVWQEMEMRGRKKEMIYTQASQ